MERVIEKNSVFGTIGMFFEGVKSICNALTESETVKGENFDAQVEEIKKMQTRNLDEMAENISKVYIPLGDEVCEKVKVSEDKARIEVQKQKAQTKSEIQKTIEE